MNGELGPAVRFAAIPDLDPDIAEEVGHFWWPLERLGEGLEELARRAGLSREAPLEPLLVPQSFSLGHTGDVADWLEWAAERLGVEAEPVDSSIPDVADLLRAAGPAIVLHAEGRAPGFLLLLGSLRGAPRLLSPDLKVRSCRLESLRTALCWQREASLLPEIVRLLGAAGVPPRRQPSVKAAVLRERLSTERLGGVWMLRLPASAAFWRQLVHAGVPRKIGAALAVFAVIYALEILGWTLIGGAALNGRLDFGWMAAWLLLVMSIIPLRFMGSWFEALFALDTGRILKSRLLAGALQMDLEKVTRQGVGHLLGRVMESQALESLAINGGMAALVATLELVFAAWILWAGAAGGLHLVLLAGCLILTAVLSWRYYRRLRDWSLQRLDMTQDLIERMVGHRTRLAQERAARRDAIEDRTLQSYLQASKAMDRSGVFVLAGLPSAWLLIGLLGLVPAFVGGAAPSPTAMAISLGGMLVAQRALGGISGGLAGLARAKIAWGQMSALFLAGHSEAAAQPFLSAAQMRGAGGQMPLIDAQGLNFCYEQTNESVLQGVDLKVGRGDRILLEGASGGGKSTLAALLTGLRTPGAGLLLLNGLDRHTLGENWHRLATSAPQFHENHVLSGTLAFNLLMGREWPAPEADLAEAAALCEELGLGDLLRRMPAGLMQRVGETGWQLSHGERSRIFLARALLQRAQLTIMDESFAALDPETLEKCLHASLLRAEALIVIAHP